MTDGVLTEEELQYLPDKAAGMYMVASMIGDENTLYLCYELAQAKLEIERLRDDRG